jgi:hypothetical protein
MIGYHASANRWELTGRREASERQAGDDDYRSLEHY